MKWWKYILGLFGALAGMLLFERSKRKSAEGLLGNLETKEKALELDREGVKPSTALEFEALRRAEEKALAAKKLEESPSHADMVEFLRRPDDRG